MTRISRELVLAVAATFALACSDHATSPTAAAPRLSLASTALHDSIRQIAVGRGITPLRRFPTVRPALVELGQALLFDPILSGNRDISCMTCHHPSLATGDARHLAIGQGAKGLGAKRVHPQNLFIPRNAPPLFNLHVMDKLFWDGRVTVDPGGVIETPAGGFLTADMRKVFEFGALSALGLFPVVSREEMRGFAGNELAAIEDGRFHRIWGALMRRLGSFPEYRQLFEQAYPGTRFDRMTFAHASNAMAGFMIEKLTFNDSPWDRFFAGDDAALTPKQLRGAFNFMSARCSICHNGSAFSDGDFHNVALAQFGPGQGDGAAQNDDFGRERVTRDPKDRYRFRSTPLRNVELTGPYGHSGQFVSLTEFVDHYSESDRKLFEYDTRQIEPLLRSSVLRTFADILVRRDTLLTGVVFPRSTIEDVGAFMRALTDPAARNLRQLIPERVPSGLVVER